MPDGTYWASSNTLYFEEIDNGLSTISIDLIDAVTKQVGEHVEITVHVLSNAEFIQLNLNATSSDGDGREGETGGNGYTPDFGVLKKKCKPKIGSKGD